MGSELERRQNQGLLRRAFLKLTATIAFVKTDPGLINNSHTRPPRQHRRQRLIGDRHPLRTDGHKRVYLANPQGVLARRGLATGGRVYVLGCFFFIPFIPALITPFRLLLRIKHGAPPRAHSLFGRPDGGLALSFSMFIAL